MSEKLQVVGTVPDKEVNSLKARLGTVEGFPDEVTPEPENHPSSSDSSSGRVDPVPEFLGGVPDVQV